MTSDDVNSGKSIAASELTVPLWDQGLPGHRIGSRFCGLGTAALDNVLGLCEAVVSLAPVSKLYVCAQRSSDKHALPCGAR